ncbi:hypothetical protein [Sphingobium ummariense]|uniref:hypothetical protein n=1 Tax=Sphingobium ummariense TaxID=420994 RepID=UPI0012683F7D|nr:hypothetical protein [Sphingobium ummariense]
MKLSNRQFYVVASVLIFLIVLAISGQGGGGQPGVAMENGAAAAEAKELAAGEKRDEARGFHCLSDWDGSNGSLVEQVKENLRNPKSFEHDETRIWPARRTGYHPARMKYRAENGFGGMNVEQVMAAIDHKTCAATIITNPDQMNDLLPSI